MLSFPLVGLVIDPRPSSLDLLPSSLSGIQQTEVSNSCALSPPCQPSTLSRMAQSKLLRLANQSIFCCLDTLACTGQRSQAPQLRSKKKNDSRVPPLKYRKDARVRQEIDRNGISVAFPNGPHAGAKPPQNLPWGSEVECSSA